MSFKEILDKKKKIQQKFFERIDEVKTIKAQFSKINDEIQLIYKNIDSKYKSEESVNQRLKEIDDKMNITSLKPKEEKELIKQIDFLKKSITFVK